MKMARDYIRKTTQTSWNQINIKEAIRVINNKEIGLRKAVRTFDVPNDSLRWRINKLKHAGPNNNILDIYINLLGRFRNVLSESQDLELKQYINMDKTFYGVTIIDIFLKIANAIKLLIDSIKKKDWPMRILCEVFSSVRKIHLYESARSSNK